MVLVGLPAVGKTTVGRVLAERMGRAHLDTDALVEDAEDATVTEVFARGGEAAFRAAEASAVARALDGPPAVISLGGGAVLDAATRERLADGSVTVVWLQATGCTLQERLEGGTGRPLLSGRKAREVVAELREQRTSLYAEVAHARVKVDGLTPEAIVDVVLEAIA